MTARWAVAFAWLAHVLAPAGTQGRKTSRARLFDRTGMYLALYGLVFGLLDRVRGCRGDRSADLPHRSGRRRRIGHLADALDAQPCCRGQQALLILMAGLAAARGRGRSGNRLSGPVPLRSAWAPRSGTSIATSRPACPGYAARRHPAWAAGQGVFRKLRMVFPVSCQAGAQDAAGFEQRLVDRVPVGSERGGQRGGGNAVERDGGEHCALLAAEVLIDGAAQRAEKRVLFRALVRLEAGGKPVPVFLFRATVSWSARSGGQPPPTRKTSANLPCQVLNLLWPQKPSSCAVIAVSASAAACRARWSRSGPLWLAPIRSCGPPRGEPCAAAVRAAGPGPRGAPRQEIAARPATPATPDPARAASMPGTPGRLGPSSGPRRDAQVIGEGRVLAGVLVHAAAPPAVRTRLLTPATGPGGYDGPGSPD